jgi:hypothetical protein
MSILGTDGNGDWYLKDSIHLDYHSCLTSNVGFDSNQEQVVNNKVLFKHNTIQFSQRLLTSNCLDMEFPSSDLGSLGS